MIEVKTTNRNIEDLAIPFKYKVILALNEVQRLYGDIIFVTETKRSVARQLYLLSTGASKTLKSMHISWNAVDIAFKGKELYPKSNKERKKVVDIFKSYGMIWGWDWKTFVDKPHFQDNWKPLDELLLIMIQSMTFYKEIYEKENKDTEKPILNPQVAIDNLTKLYKNGKTDEFISEFVYFLSIGLERLSKIDKKKSSMS